MLLCDMAGAYVCMLCCGIAMYRGAVCMFVSYVALLCYVVLWGVVVCC